jgi:nucleoside-diphosphate-sugar epimerase
VLRGDVHGDEAQLARLLAGQRFDVVVDFIAFTLADIERDLRLFRDNTAQFVFISSASAYQKPPQHYRITEETPLANPFWEYSRNKIDIEARLMRAHREHGFPVTIVRPSHTYGPSQIPFAVGSWRQPWSNIDRILNRKPVIVPGDGTSLWVLTWNADFAIAFQGLLGNARAIGEAFHITSDEVLTWNQITNEVFGALGVEPNLVHIPSDFIARYSPEAVGSLIGDKANSVVFDNTKVKRLVPDFVCRVAWAEGVRRAIEWHRADPSRQTVDVDEEQLWDRVIAAYGAGPAR